MVSSMIFINIKYTTKMYLVRGKFYAEEPFEIIKRLFKFLFLEREFLTK